MVLLGIRRHLVLESLQLLVCHLKGYNPFQLRQPASARGVHDLLLLILESLGSTELFFILVMALVFFGPRKLPQLSRTLGKNLASFRRASEDFKRTWDREVTLEEINGQLMDETPGNSTSPQSTDAVLQPPTIEAIAPERVVPRTSAGIDAPPAVATSTEQNTSSRKSDWL